MCDEVRICPQCERPATRFTAGVCNACYRYYSSHGTYKRTGARRRTKVMRDSVCGVCKTRRANGGFIGGKNTCKRCYSYYRDNGRHRPRWRDRDTCRNPVCKRPLIANCRFGGYHAALGYCKNCYQYQRKHGGELRSEEMIKREAPHGWCECGKPAVEVRQLTGVLVTDFNDPKEWAEPLCAECAALEDEPLYAGGNDVVAGGTIRRDARD